MRRAAPAQMGEPWGGARADVQGQPNNPGKAPLLERLQGCRAEALERLPPAQRPAR